MRRFALWLVVGCIGLLAPCLKLTEIAADEIAGMLQARAAAEQGVGFDEVLQFWSHPAKFEAALKAWAKVSRECRSCDAKFTRWEYDPIFGDATKPKRVSIGRYLLQRNGASRYVDENEWDYVWRGGELLDLRRHVGEYRVYGAPWIAAAEQWRRAPRKLDFFEMLLLAGVLGPTQAVPFLFLDDLEKFRADHDLTYEFTPEEIRIVGEPKTGELAAQYRRVSVLIRTGESLPYAVKLEKPSGNGSVVFQMHEPRLDGLPSDAETFLNLDLSGLKRVEMETEESLQEAREKIIGKPVSAKKPR